MKCAESRSTVRQVGRTGAVARYQEIEDLRLVFRYNLRTGRNAQLVLQIRALFREISLQGFAEKDQFRFIPVAKQHHLAAFGRGGRRKGTAAFAARLVEFDV